MTPALESLVLVCAALALIALALWMRDLFLPPARALTPLVSGAVTAALASMLPTGTMTPGYWIGCGFTLIALLHLRNDDLTLPDALACGHSIASGGALMLLAYGTDEPFQILAALLASGLVGSATLCVTSRHSVAIRAAGILSAVVLASLSAHSLMSLPAAPLRPVAYVLFSLVPLLLFLDVFARANAIATELRDEAKFGLFPSEEVSTAAHPFRRLGSAGWPDRTTRRRFVNLSRELALGKIRQRSMTPERARLYQLEVLKLRMDLQQTLTVHEAIKREVRLRTESLAESSATMSSKGGSA